MKKSKYIHSEKDKDDDILFIKKFTCQFENRIMQHLQLSVYNLGKLDGIEDFQYCVRDNILQNAETIYSMCYDKGIAEMIWIRTGINPNGIVENIFARTFTIKYQKRVQEKIIGKFYDYSRSHEDVINKFELFLQRKN